MKETFRDSLHMKQPNLDRLKTVNKIIEEYRDQGYRLTLRQLYYQLVSRGIIPNTKSEYAKLSTLLVKGRMAGFVDWQAIEDRIRVPFLPYWVEDIEDALSDTISQYRLDRQKGQKTYIELWVEKDALSGVLKKITSKYHIHLVVTRGYISCSAIYDAYKRFYQAEMCGKRSVILYFGDHDPSGIDMIRDIRTRLKEFDVEVDLLPLGITKEQIDKYNPPPNPAKTTDPRGTGYIKKFGAISWEVDALNPKILHKLAIDAVENLIELDLFEEQIEKEDTDKEALKKVSERGEPDE